MAWPWIVGLICAIGCTAQTVDPRIDKLLGHMTLEEKVSQLMNDSPAIGRLGIPAYNWWSEALHGVAFSGRATVFPEPIGLAASWDPALLHRVAEAISDEARAKFHEYQRRGKHGMNHGLTLWAPNINLFRDPRWGRGMETYGEDPYLTGRLAVSYVRGLQGDDPRYLKTIATVKHFAAHSGPEPLRHTFDVHLPDQELRESYLPHFEAAIREGQAYSVMCSYNRVNGLPACANPKLLEQILRREWGFQGFVVSDCGAIGDIYKTHKFAASPEMAAAKALKAGCDLSCGTEYGALVGAVRQGLIEEREIDRSVRRLLTARFRLGLFDPPEQVSYARIPYSANESPENGALALQAARESVVLLKNSGELLPFGPKLRTIAVIGPNADSVEVLEGNYNGDSSAPVTVLAGIRQRAAAANVRLLYSPGSGLARGVPRFETIPAKALFVAPGRPGLAGKYFNTAAFAGGALANETAEETSQPLFERVDSTIDFRWGEGAPRPDMHDDGFGVRWSGYLKVPVGGLYHIGAIGLTAFEVYVDGKQIAKYSSGDTRSYAAQPVELKAGQLYPLRVDYRQTGGSADIRLVWSRPDQDGEAEALEAARQADAVVLALGLSPRLENEEMPESVEGFRGGDRIELGLPNMQEELLKKVAAVGKPVVLVLLNGSALAVNWASEHVPAIVELWYPGQAGGTALAEVLFGDYNPGGRLPVTFYQSAAQLPPFEDYNMRGRTYRYFQGEPLFPFGYGLSYTRFAYSGLAIRPVGGDLEVSAELRNAGSRAGDEVVQLYVLRPAGVPRSLEAFERVTLQPGEKRRVVFQVQAARWKGAQEIAVGGKQPGFGGAADAPTTEVLVSKIARR